VPRRIGLVVATTVRRNMGAEAEQRTCVSGTLREGFRVVSRRISSYSVILANIVSRRT